MSHQTMVTVQGWIGTTPMLREVGGVPVLNFRLGCTPRHFSRASGTWVDGQPQWYGVSAWRRLATHGGPSLHQGDPVLVHGRLEHRTYVNKSGLEVVALEIEALTIGHDLTRGVATFVKAASAAAAGDPDHDRGAAAA
ncbi:single-stranded DNA-binding protein [Nocardioides carbamazepini]|uniref:single-stranded DNA-binding protein n=1 Tax=Nocardioides carbamazepini TaxID=2854259 RepID=UPI002149B6BE|nr:single-stranded DNA-binding protein [Nocardioides carbamazepini]MCR1782094.1 single-stranded DNA-binding protein [Nocardioides carbamazepini]